MTGFMIFWQECSDSFASEITKTAHQLRPWFEAKIKTDSKKMSNIFLRHFENGKMIDEHKINAHQIVKDDCITTELFKFYEKK